MRDNKIRQATGGLGGRGRAGSGGRGRGREVLSRRHSVTINGETTRASRHESQLFVPGVTGGFRCDAPGCQYASIRDWGAKDVHASREGLLRRFCGPVHYATHVDPKAKRLCTERDCVGFAPHGGQKGARCLKCAAACKRRNTGGGA